MDRIQLRTTLDGYYREVEVADSRQATPGDGSAARQHGGHHPRQLPRRLGSRQRVQHPRRLGPRARLPGARRRRRPRLRARASHRPPDARAAALDDGPGQQGRSLQVQSRPQGRPARQVRHRDGRPRRQRRGLGSPADRRDVAVPAHARADDHVRALGHLDAGRGQLRPEPRLLHRTRLPHARLRDLGARRQAQSRQRGDQRQLGRHGQGRARSPGRLQPVRLARLAGVGAARRSRQHRASQPDAALDAAARVQHQGDRRRAAVDHRLSGVRRARRRARRSGENGGRRASCQAATGSSASCAMVIRPCSRTRAACTTRQEELQRFAHIESEWPLFFTYLLRRQPDVRRHAGRRRVRGALATGRDRAGRHRALAGAVLRAGGGHRRRKDQPGLAGPPAQRQRAAGLGAEPVPARAHAEGPRAPAQRHRSAGAAPASRATTARGAAGVPRRG